MKNKENFIGILTDKEAKKMKKKISSFKRSFDKDIDRRNKILTNNNIKKTINPYPKIFHIGENYIENLFKGKVEITEKIDGSQWDFGINEDKEIVFRSKGEDLTFKTVPKMFGKAKEQVDRLAPILKKNFRDTYFYCEFLSSPKHNILEYERIPKNGLYLFGVKEQGKFVGDIKKLQELADFLELEKVNVLFVGEIKNIKDLEKLLENNSILGKEKIEGIVVKNYQEPALLGSMIIPISMGKYVREEFKERSKTEWNKRFTGKGKLGLFIESFRSEARWQKAVQHLKELDKLENSPRDIENLMKEIDRDILEEEKENIKESLFKIFEDDILRKSKRGFAEWYKKQLLTKSIKNN